METRILDSTLQDRWDAYVSTCPHAVAWHMSGWSRAVSSCYATEYLPLAALEGGEIRGVLPLYRLTQGPASDSLLSIPFAVAGGIAADGELVEAALLERAVALLGERRLSRLVLKQYKRRIEGELQTDDAYFNRELALGNDLESIWAEISKENQERIERTNALRVTLEYPSTDVEQFFALLTRHQRDTGIPGPNVNWIRALQGFGMYTLALLRVDGRLEAGTLVKCFKDTVSFPYTCLRRQDVVHVDLACRLYWELIRERARAGTRIFHSGRLPRAGGTNDYRLGWGGVAHGYFYQYYPPRQGTTESIQKRGWKRNLLQATWKCLPIPIARTLGQKIVCRYP
jgi:hypothetical protein